MIFVGVTDWGNEVSHVNSWYDESSVADINRKWLTIKPNSTGRIGINHDRAIIF